MKAIILAAGRGSRMLEGTANLPKCMMKLWGRPILEHCLESLEKSGFNPSDIGIVTGYKSEVIDYKGYNYFHNPDWETTNMFVSLTKAEGWLCSEPCIISYADIIFSANAVKKLIASKNDISITYYNGFWELWSSRFDDPLSDLETFKILDGRLVEIGKKPKAKDEVQGQYMGLLKFEVPGWKKIAEAINLPMPKTVQKLDMTTLLQHLITQGNDIHVIETSDIWLECDNQNDINVYEKIYAQKPSLEL